MLGRSYLLNIILSLNIYKLSPEMSGFGDLLQQAEQLTADIESGGELPRIERNLHQLAEAGDRLWKKTAGGVGEDDDVRA